MSGAIFAHLDNCTILHTDKGIKCDHGTPLIQECAPCIVAYSNRDRVPMPNLRKALTDPRGIGLSDVLAAAEQDRPGCVKRQSAQDYWLERTEHGAFQ